MVDWLKNKLSTTLQRFGFKLTKVSSEWDLTDSPELQAVRSWVFDHSPHPQYARTYFKHEVGAWGPIPALIYLLSQLQMPKEFGRKVLDIGCGFGTLISYCSEFGYKPYVVDFVPPDFHVGEESINKFGIEYHHLNIEVSDLPFPAETFSLVLMSEVLEHFNFQPLDVLAKVHNVLRKDGFLLISTPALGRTQKPEVYQQPFEQIPRYSGQPHEFVDRHMKIYAKTELTRLLHSAGFRSFVALHMNPITGIEHLYAIASK
jgi:SAM-dependent methyltransferase